MASKSNVGHRWRFWRAGGVDQVRIETGDDVLHVDELDPKLWVALCCPVKGLELDERTLEMLDTDRDGRVRVPEIVAAARWLRSVLKHGDSLVRGEDGVPLDVIDGSSPEGKRVLAGARHVLKSLGREAAGKVTVEDAARTEEFFSKATHNGDGVVPPAVVADEGARRVAGELVECVGSVADRSGKKGFDGVLLERFFAECRAYEAWWAKAEKDPATQPLGAETAAAVAAYETVRGKIDDWFHRSRLAAYDPRSAAAVNGTEDAYRTLLAKDLSSSAAEVAGLPLAVVDASKPLPLTKGLNPAWTDAVARFCDRVVAPMLGKERTSLSYEDWLAIGARLAPHLAWQAAKEGASVERLGVARVREILAGQSHVALSAAIADDLAVAGEVAALADVERLARLHRDFHRLLENFVSFTDFYARRKAVFQSGTLYLDGRATDLCVQVTDPAKHAAVAGLARTYIAYMDCTRASGEKMSVAAAMTAGDRDNLFVGRNALFFDRRGRDWDATIARIVDHPISVSQAFWAPYKKLIRWIEDTIAKRAAAADDASTARLQSAAAPAVAGGGAAPAPASKPKLDFGTLAVIGIAFGAISSAIGLFLQALFGLGILMPLGILGIVLLISGPSMLIAWMKLRQRNLGPILDANGWAVNTLTRVNLPLGRSLTSIATLPAGAERSFKDPYAERRRWWPRVLLVLLLLGAIGFGAWKTGYLSKWLPWLPRPAHPWCGCDADVPGDEKRGAAPADGGAEGMR